MSVVPRFRHINKDYFHFLGYVDFYDVWWNSNTNDVILRFGHLDLDQRSMNVVNAEISNDRYMKRAVDLLRTYVKTKKINNKLTHLLN